MKTRVSVCPHHIINFPIENYRVDKQVGICKDCGAEVPTSGFKYVDEIPWYEKMRNRHKNNRNYVKQEEFSLFRKRKTY